MTMIEKPPADWKQANDEAPLEHFRVIGVEEKVVQVAKDAPRQPGSSCWHCGTGIMICVVCKNLQTGEIVDIGTTCAERIGLDPEGLKRYLKERRDRIRAERWAAEAEDRRLHAEYVSAEIAAKYGEHGTEGRYAYGCRCGECNEVAPHGTNEHFWAHDCSCEACVKAVLVAHDDYRIREMDVLVDLRTGRVANARLIDGKYGMSWMVKNDTGIVVDFVPTGRKRRDTVAKRGYTYAKADYLVRPPRDYKEAPWRIRQLSTPTVDDFGEPIPAG